MRHLIGYGALTLVIIGLVFMLYSEHKEKNIAQTTVTQKEKVVNAAAALINTYKDKNGSSHSTFKPADKIKDPLTAVISKPLLDSIISIVNKNGIKAEQLETWYNIATTSQAKELKATVKVDSLKKVIAYVYRSKYLDLTFNPPVLGDTTSQGTFDYRYDTDLSVTQYWQRKRILGLPIGAKESFIDIYSKDTLATVNGLKSIQVKQSAPKFEISTPSMVVYNPNGRNFLLGQGLSIRYGKLSAVGGYAYDINTRKTVPLVGFAINWLK